MRMSDIIDKKKYDTELSFEEIQYVIHGYVNGTIPDYQVSAWLMTVYFNGMSEEEAFYLTKAMIESGDQLDLSAISKAKVDKHSTGGVGDKVSLIIAPIIACFDLAMAKMSGRGLGLTGGTIDKLESIPNINVEQPVDTFIDTVKSVGFALIGQTGNLVPADKKLYALRDVTGTVDSIPLIASSIVSKKIAAGNDIILLDVKFGQGAFMKDAESAKELAASMIGIGGRFNKKFAALITDMNQPLGSMVGNAFEVYESIEILKGRGDSHLRQICVDTVAYLLRLSEQFAELDEAIEQINKVIDDGSAYNKFAEYVQAFGGNLDVFEDENWVFSCTSKLEIKALCDGYIHQIDAETIGRAAMIAGAGREKKEDSIDHHAGIQFIKQYGDEVQEGDVVGYLYTNKSIASELIADLQQAVHIKPSAPADHKHIYSYME
ncbi:thymidine phosphorylase [Paenibacillus sp. PR3]|uniref:Pyrimidine-nucleoside phosphorylase n=1 Tax=Paenibacillus terricola TaxID=2763503 RepID=A0ABR8MRW2_9BACL|nr:thymidine phosphorylase [Paenibacillus terricola]MBD3918731.1 thymidine phosphorylase [Paenibacillus terricola]